MENLNKKILLVDDDDLLRGIYANKFREEGFEVITATNGKEAWDIIEGGNTPDLVFTGIIMPVMSGFELIAKIKAVPKLANISIAISSHRGLAEDQKKAKDLGVNDFMVQGNISPNEVVYRIRAIFGLQNPFQIEFLPNRLDANIFIDVLNRQQATSCGNIAGQKMILELKPGEKAGEFKVKLVC